MKIQKNSHNSSLGAYIHVPWCRRRCAYCDFYFEIGSPKIGFGEAILKDFDFKIKNFKQSEISTLYFGGGTPSRLELEVLVNIINSLRERIKFDENIEITLEANPEDLDLKKLKDIKKSGVNRLSLGVQSLDDVVLHWLGRKHRRAEAQKVILDSVSQGFNLSVDVIIGVPSESLKKLKQDLIWMRNAGVAHISVYILGVEPNAPLQKLIKRGVRENIEDSKQAEAYRFVQKELFALGYEQYEISNYALPGHESQHNKIYWSKGDYIGLGPSAHSLCVLPSGESYRFSSISNYKIWAAAPEKALNFTERLSPRAAFLEAFAFGIRDMGAGVSSEELASRHNFYNLLKSNDIIEGVLELFARLESEKYIRSSKNRYFLTEYGALFADHVSREILGL